MAMMMMMTSDHQPRQAPTHWQWGEMGAGGSLAGLPRWGAWSRSAASWWWMWTAWPSLPRWGAWSRSAAAAGSPIEAEPAMGQMGGWKMGVRDGRAAPEEGTNRSLIWHLAKDSEVWLCHRGKWQKTMDDPAIVFVTIWLLSCFSFVQNTLFRGHFISLHLVLSLSFLTCSSAGNICLSYVYMRLKRWRLPRKLVQ